MKRVIRLVFLLIGAVLGIVVFGIVNAAFGLVPNSGKLILWAKVISSALFAIIFYFATDPISKRAAVSLSKFEKKISKLPAANLAVGVIGIILGFVIATLVSIPLTKLSLPYMGNSFFVLLSILLYIGFGYLGWRVSVRNSEDFLNLFKNVKDVKEQKSILKHDKNKNLATAKILDTSVIIDGRIVDILNTEFIEGDLIISEFVLEELQHIADSPDDLKRERGRRGLDIVNEIKNNEKTNLVIVDTDYPEIKEVDSKLLKLAIDLNGKIFTNDYNLNKVCDVQGIPVLNINDLANALKPVVLPGESMEIEVIKLGKGRNQGVGYLEDGTMVVVEDGDKYLDKTIIATVTSVLQTSAGRMIFVKSKED